MLSNNKHLKTPMPNSGLIFFKDSKNLRNLRNKESSLKKDKLETFNLNYNNSGEK